MKAFNFLSYSTFFLAIMFSTTLFDAEGQSDKQNLKKSPIEATMNKTAKLPLMIKINPSDVDMTRNPFDKNMAIAKKEGKEMIKLTSDISHVLPVVEQNVTIYRNKVNECMNKTYTTQDQKNASCTDDMTVAQCSQNLFSWCKSQELNKVIGSSLGLGTIVSRLEYSVKEFKTSVYNIGQAGGSGAH